MSLKKYSFRFLLSLLLVFSLLLQNFYVLLFDSSAQDNTLSVLEQTVSANLDVPEPEEGLIAILIDKENYQNNQIATNLKTYADTLATKLPSTRSMIVTISRDESEIKIASLLENLYREEGLIGTVIVGEVPIPILTKEDISFPSVFPYIDFDSKLWVYDAKIGEEKFILNDFSDNKEPEIFAGVIKPPFETDSSEYTSALALFLTKITNYHNGANPAEKKISLLDTINRPILGEASGTTKDYIDQTITAILQMGRYDLNFYELNREEQEKLEDCGKGFIPATIKVVKAISKIRPWNPETLKYLLTPLIYIPPIPLNREEPEQITLPEIPDLSSFTDFTTKISCASKLPDPSLLSSLKDTIPTISKLTEINPTNLLNLKDAIPTNPLPDVSEFQNITEKITDFTATKNSQGIVKKAYAGLENLDLLKNSLGSLENISLPDTAILEQAINEIKNGTPGPESLPGQSFNIPNLDSLNSLDVTKVSQFLEQAKKLQNLEIPNLEDFKLETLLGDDLDITSFSSKLNEVAGQIAIPEVPLDLQNIIKQSIPDIGSSLDNLGFSPEELVIYVQPNQGLNSKNIIPRSRAKLEIPAFDLSALTPTLSVLNDLPALPKMPDLPNFSWTIEIPPPFFPIVLPGLPTIPALNLMTDFYILPLDMITPPSPLPPAGFMSRIKGMLKIPDFPEIPEIPKAPNLDKEISLLESFCQIPDLSPIQEIASSNFLKDLQDTATLSHKSSKNRQIAYAALTNLDQLVELTNLVEKPEFAIIKNLTEIDLDGFSNELEKITGIMDLVKNPEESGLNELNKLKASVGDIDANTLTEQLTNLKASQLNPNTLASLKQNLLPNLEKLQSLSSALNPGAVLGDSIDRSENSEPGKVLGISTINYTEKIDQLSSSLGEIEKVKESFSDVEKMLEPITNLQGQIGALTSIIDISDKLTEVNNIISQVKQIGDITAPITDFQKNFDDLMPKQTKKNLESLKNIGKVPEPDLMSLISLDITGYTPPTNIKMPELDKISDPLEVTGDTSKTILNQDIYKNLLSPSKQAWEILCESNGSEFEDLDKLIQDSSYYNENDIKEIDREAKMYNEDYMRTFFKNLVTTPDSALNKKYFLENLVPGTTEIAILNAKGTSTQIDFTDLLLEGKDILAPKSLISLLTGAAYGDITEKDYLAGHQLFKGETLSVISFTGLNLGNTDEPIDIGASQDFGFGIFNEAPFLSVLAEGEIPIGEALRPFQTESQILLGDPTISLPLQQKNADNDYSITFGETIPHYNSGKNLIVSADFNNDGAQDIISVNSLNGHIQLFRGVPQSARTRFINEGIIYKFELPDIDMEKLSEINTALGDEAIPENQKTELSQKKENLMKIKILKINTGDFDNNETPDLAIHYSDSSENQEEKVSILLNDGKSNFKKVEEIPFTQENVKTSSEDVIPENIIAYQFGSNPFSSQSRFKIVKNDFDNDGDEDLVFSTEKNLQFKENLKNGKNQKTKQNKPHLFQEMTNLESITKPIDVKEIVPNEGYAEISWYQSYLEDLAGYNVYFSQEDRFLFDKKQIIPLSTLSNPLNPEYRLFGLENDKRVYVTITAYTNDGKETTISQILQTTPQVELDYDPPIAVIKAKNEVLINSLNDFSASSSIENSKHLTFSWDFDLATDTDGDGNTENDQDSTEEKPTYLYEVLGKYKIGLKVEDMNQNSAITTHDIEVVLPSNLVITLEDELVLFLNEMAPNLNVAYYKIPAGKLENEAEIVKEKITDANGFVSYAPVINTPGSKIISKETGEPAILINTEETLIETDLNNSLELRFDQTRIVLEDDDKKVFATIFFVHDRNQDALTVSNLQEIQNYSESTNGVFIEDYDKNDSFLLKTGDSGSIRLVEEKETVEKTYATFLPSGGMYLDNSTYLEWAKDERSEFIFNLKLKDQEKILAKILLKPLIGNSKISRASSFDTFSPGIYITYNDDFLSFENTADFETGDSLFAIVSDKLGNQSPKTNIIKLRKHHTTKELALEDIVPNAPAGITEDPKVSGDDGQVLGASTSRVNKYQQAINLNKESDVFSDSSPTLYGRTARFNTELFLTIQDETKNPVTQTKIQVDKTGNFDYSITRNLSEGIYQSVITDANNQIIQLSSFEIDLTPPEMPFVEGFDGEKKVIGKTSPNSIILAYNYNSVFDPITTTTSDHEGKFLVEFPTSTSHFTLFATDQAGNKSETKEVFYNPEGLNEQKENQALQNVSTELQTETDLKNKKYPERFLGIFILCIGLATLIYNKKDELFPRY